jgi:hypothetical protein
LVLRDDIRSLASEGLRTAEIAKRLEIRYQQVYAVLRPKQRALKPQLPIQTLLTAGFERVAVWRLSSANELYPDRPIPPNAGVYAFGREETALYVGVATMGLAKRLRFYSRPGISQVTSQRLNAKLKQEIASESEIGIYVALPPDMNWNGLPVHGGAGLELGLIKAYALPWNMRSAG